MSISRLITSVLIAFVAAIALYAGVFFAKKQFTVQSVDEGVLQFSLKDTTGKVFDHTDWEGKVILVNFWATWCTPCREEMPMLADFQDRYGEQGLQIIGIALDESEPVQRFANSMAINYPLLMADDTTPELMHQYNEIGAIPFSLITDRNGKINQTKLGVFSADELKAMIEPLLKQK